MYSLHLTCVALEAEKVSVALWEAGTVGVQEIPSGDHVILIAGFEKAFDSSAFAEYRPKWEREDEIDWVSATRQAWPGRIIGERIFLAPLWNSDATPEGRVRVIHNPGRASGTGEHPCTRLALESLERCIDRNTSVIDVGTGSGILSIASLRLGARMAIAVDMDTESLITTRENFVSNELTPTVCAGSADCVAPEVGDVVVANISGTVLLSMADEIVRILRPGGKLILSGFPESELSVLKETFGMGETTTLDEWRCLTIQVRTA